MKISIDDVNEIVNKVTQGWGNYTPLEAELARMCLKYRATIGRIGSEKAKMFNDLYSVYSSINRTKCASELREVHKKVLAGNSKAMFENAVKFDQKLKELNDEE